MKMTRRHWKKFFLNLYHGFHSVILIAWVLRSEFPTIVMSFITENELVESKAEAKRVELKLLTDGKLFTRAHAPVPKPGKPS